MSTAAETPPPADAPEGTGPSDPDGTGARRRHRLPFWAELPILLLVVAAVAVGVQGFLVRLYVVPSASMETTLHGCPGCTDDRIAVDKLSYRFGAPQPGDIVVFRGTGPWAANGEVSSQRPADPVRATLNDLGARASLSSPDEKDFVKRVVAVEGQTVACCDAQNHVTVDGRPLAEPYLHISPGGPAGQEAFAPVRLGPGQLWVLGDNRNNSADSRDHGPVAVGDVIGEARAIVWPVGRWAAGM